MMKMKELEERSGIGRETIRYYIREGLLPEPDRPKTNVAIYSEAHLRRLELIRTLQRERFLPLGVIRKLIEEAGDREPDTVPGLFGLEIMLADRLGTENSRTPVDLDKLSEDSGMSMEEIHQIAEKGLITPHETPAGKQAVSTQDAALISSWARVQALGFSIDKGYGVDYLMQYHALAEAMAEFDVTAFYDRLADDLDTDTAASMASSAIPQALEVFGHLRTKAILRKVAEHNAKLLEEEHSTSTDASADGSSDNAQPDASRKSA